MIKITTLGERLKLLRTEKNLSQEALADLLNITRSSLSSYELDRSEPPDTIKKDMADFFCVTLDYLCGYSNVRASLFCVKLNKENYIQVPIVEKIVGEKKIIKEHTYVHESKFKNGQFFYIDSPNDFSLARIKKGDLLYIREQAFIQGEALVLISLENKLLVTKLSNIKSDYVIFNPDSDYNFSYVQKDKIKIIGIIVEVTFPIKIEQ